MRTVTLALLALGATACVTAESFPDAAAKAYCDKAAECSSSVDEESCADDAATFLDCFVEHCDDFDAGAAGDCLDVIGDATCDGGGVDLQSCGDAYTGCANLELAACLLQNGLGG